MIRFLKKAHLSLLFVLAAQAHGQTEMTAEEAVRLGLKKNFDIQIARNNAKIAENNAGLGTANFLPSLDASGGYSFNQSDQETNSPFSFGASDTKTLNGQLSLNWTLFDGFRMFVDNKRFQALAKLGEFQARSLIENTVVGVLQAYFNVVQQEQLTEVVRNSRAVSEARLEKEKVRNEIGGASSTDLLNAQVAYNADAAALINQELQLEIARKELNIALGRDPQTPISVKKEIEVEPFSLPLNELLTRAEERNSELLAALQNRKIAEQDVKIARSAFFPQLSFNAAYGRSDRTTSSESEQFPEDITTNSTDKSVGLTLSFNLFNGFRNRIDLQNARIEAENQQLALDDFKNRLAGVIAETFVTFRKQMELVRLEEDNVVAARQNLQLQQDRYQIGASSSIEFRDAQVSLNRAQTTLISARFQARLTRAEMERLTGGLKINQN